MAGQTKRDFEKLYAIQTETVKLLNKKLRDQSKEIARLNKKIGELRGRGAKRKEDEE